eukprot:Partr_v1_DN28167_c1_g1_i1_m55286 putative Kelch domain containing
MFLQRLKKKISDDAIPSKDAQDDGKPRGLSLIKIAGKSPFPRRGFSAVLAGNQIICIGGMINQVPANDVAAVSLSGLCNFINPVLITGTAPTPRVFHSAALVQGKVYVFGGIGSNGSHDDGLYCFSSDTKAWSRPRVPSSVLPRGRHGHSSSVVRGMHIYFFGGQCEDGYLNDLILLNVNNLRFELMIVPPELCARAYHSMDPLGADKFVIFGGECGFDCMDDMWIFDSTSNSWAEIKYLSSERPCARYHHASAVHGDTLFIFGGKDYKGKPLGDIWAFNIYLMTWHAVGALPFARSELRACHHKDRIYMLGGHQAHETDFNSLITFDLSKFKVPVKAAPNVGPHPWDVVSIPRPATSAVPLNPPAVIPALEASETAATVKIQSESLTSQPALRRTIASAQESSLKDDSRKVKLLEAGLKSIRDDNIRLKERCDALEAQNLLISQSKNSNMGIIQDLESQLSSMKEQLSLSHSSSLNNIPPPPPPLPSPLLVNYDVELEKAASLLEARNAKISELECNIGDLEMVNLELDGKLARSDTAIQQALAENKTLKMQIKHLNMSTEVKSDASARELAEANCRINGFLATISSKDAELSALTLALNKKLEDDRLITENCQKSSTSLVDQVELLQTESSTLRAANERLSAQEAKLNESLAQIRSEKVSIQQVNEMLEKKISKLENKLANCPAVDSYLGIIAEKEAEVEIFREHMISERNALLIEIADLNSKLNQNEINAQVELKSLGEEVSRLQGELKEVRDENESLNLTIGDITSHELVRSCNEKTLKQYQEGEISMKNSIDVIESQLVDEKSKNAKLSEKLQNVNTSLREMAAVLRINERLKMELESLKGNGLSKDATQQENPFVPPPPPPPPPSPFVSNASSVGGPPPPPPPPTGPESLSKVNNGVSSASSLQSNLLADIQKGKMLRKVRTEPLSDEPTVVLKSKPADPMALMLAEMHQKKLKSGANGSGIPPRQVNVKSQNSIDRELAEKLSSRKC